MPIKNTFRDYTLSTPKKQTLDIVKFRGVDYNPAQLSVDNSRAVDIKNIIYKDFVNQKRNGIENCAEVPIVEYYDETLDAKLDNKNSRRINGIYSFVAEDNNQHILVHAGKLLFEVTNLGANFSFTQAKWNCIGRIVYRNGFNYFVCKEFNDDFSSGFVGSKKLYILDGIKYRTVRLKDLNFVVEDVEDSENTYIPTTTVGISIGWKEKTSEGSTYAEFTPSKPTPLDDVNMLTQWRKNKLVTGVYLENDFSFKESKFFEYKLDTSIRPKKNSDINDIKVTINTTEAYERD